MLTPTVNRVPSRAKILVILAIGGAVLFGSYLGYLAWSNDSFPVEERPFADYASVLSTSFNGTELAFEVKWISADYLPLYAQLYSRTNEAANTVVCGVGLQSVVNEQVIPMPFGISKFTPVLTNVNLFIAVRSITTGLEFTLVHSVDTLSAQPGNVVPSEYACRQRAGGM